MPDCPYIFVLDTSSHENVMVYAFKLNTLQAAFIKMRTWVLGHDAMNFKEDLTQQLRVWPSEVTLPWKCRIYERMKGSFSMDKAV